MDSYQASKVDERLMKPNENGLGRNVNGAVLYSFTQGGHKLRFLKRGKRNL
jgi:hypothetical protein